MERPLQDLLLKAHANPPQTGDVPRPLPFAHAARAELFEEIVASGQLEPTRCQVFGDKRVYFYDGGVYYRSATQSTRDRRKLPVAFLFDPRLLRLAESFYPFDTGEASTNRFGDAWRRRLQPVTRFVVEPIWADCTPSIMIKEIYQNNTNYLSGEVDPLCANKSDPLPLLHQFLSEDLTKYDVDQRQCIVECHYTQPLKLHPQSGLLWIGYPHVLQEFFLDLCDVSFPSVPEVYPYSFRSPFRPSDYEAKLEEAASRVVNRYLL